MNIDNLRKEESAAFKKACAIRTKRESLERAALLPGLKSRFIGRFFKRSNSYGSHSKAWWIYQYVIDVSGKDFNILNPTFKVYSFQITSRQNNVEINRHDYTFQSTIGPREITRREFMAAHAKMLEAVKFKEAT